MTENEKETNQLPKPINRISFGLLKIRSLIRVVGFKDAVFQITKNLFWVEIMYRFIKALEIQETRVEPKIPLKIVIMPQNLNLDSWEGRKEILDIRSNYGLLQFKQRLDRGYILFCAYSDDKFAGFIWLLLPPVNRVDSGILLSEDDAYQIDGWTFNTYRGKGVLPSLQQATYDYLRKEFPYIKAVITHGAVGNKPSIIGQQRSGLIVVSRELSVSVFGYNRKIKLNDVKRTK